MQTPNVETRDQRRARLTAFRNWSEAVAQTLGGKLQPQPKDDSHPQWERAVLPGGEIISLHLDPYDARVSVSGSWPRDNRHGYTSPRDCLRGDLAKDSSINVGADRSPTKAAADITRRFLPLFKQQWAGIAEVIKARQCRDSRRCSRVEGPRRQRHD